MFGREKAEELGMGGFLAVDVGSEQEGKFVVLDFFYSTCGACMVTSTKISHAHDYFGCNTADVIFLSISLSDDNEACLDYEANNSVRFPTISAPDGGAVINSDYQITSYPTITLIAPDHSIAISNIYPIVTSQDVIDQLEVFGISQSDCITDVEVINNQATPISNLSIYPNPCVNSTYISFFLDENKDVTVEIFNTLGELVYTDDKGSLNSGNNKFEVNTNKLSKGIYVVNLNVGSSTITKKISIIK